MTALARRWWAPEVVQTSAMDCGPAALKAFFAGHGRPLHLGHLRAACQTSLDGTSIDTLEQVGQRLGLPLEQVMLPRDLWLLPAARALPAIVVVQLPDGSPHFVVVWRRLGPWLQVMDPATGRRWVRARTFLHELLVHELAVPHADWLAWAQDTEHQALQRQRLLALGADAAEARAWLDEATAEPTGHALAALDAALRLTQQLVDGRALRPGPSARSLARALWRQALASTDDIHRHLPAEHWAASPLVSDTITADAAAPNAPRRLRWRGVVLLRVAGPADAPSAGSADTPAPINADAAAPIDDTDSLAAALRTPPAGVWAPLWDWLRADGWAVPARLLGAVAAAAALLVLQALLMRALFDVVQGLGDPAARAAAVAAVAAVAALLWAFDVATVRESLRLGRRLETRLRAALLQQLARLDDAYFQTRAVPDQAERMHRLQGVRQAPLLALQGVQALAEALLTLAALAWLAAALLPGAAALLLAGLLLPALVQPWLQARDLRLRQHEAALGGFVLDALQGAAPIRTHGAQAALQQAHGTLLGAWAQARRQAQAVGLWSETAQQLLLTAGAVGLFLQRPAAAGGLGAGDLLLLYWLLKLPALGGQLAGLLRGAAAQHSALQRLLEPLQQAPADAGPLAADAPHFGDPTGDRSSAQLSDRADGQPDAPPAHAPRGPALHLRGVTVQAGGHALLKDVNLDLAPGEQVAVVGASGAGKSTLLGLLLGWHRAAGGEVRLGGEALDAAATERWRAHTAWVDPAVALFQGTVLDNLRWGLPDGARPDLDRAIALADLGPVLARLPQGLQTVLGDGGTALSGGEGQRLRLARALLRADARLVLLDEPFRGLERPQRQALLDRCRGAWPGATLLVATHDIAETQGFDRVLVIDGGRVVQDGAPAALAADATGRYAQLLQAEVALQAAWAAPDGGWQRWRLADGRLHRDGAA